MSHIFISYSHKDRAYANKLAGEMKRRGIEPWIDERIDYGDQWPHVIQEQLEACSAVAVIMSPNAYKSMWVQNEVTFAQHIGKQIFPLLLEGSLWLSLSSTQHVDVRSGQLPPDSYFYKLESQIAGTHTKREISVKQKPSSAPRRRAASTLSSDGSIQDRLFNLLAQAVQDKKGGEWNIGLYQVTYKFYRGDHSLGCAFINDDLLSRYDPAVYAEYMEAQNQMMSTYGEFSLFSPNPESGSRDPKLFGASMNNLQKVKTKLKLSAPAGAFSQELNDSQLQDFVEKFIQNHIDHHIPLDQIKIQAAQY